jgi:hypothetical protein
MYDNGHRAKAVLEGLRKAYNEKLSEDQLALCNSDQVLSTEDMQDLSMKLSALGIMLKGSVQPNKHTTTFPATFRGVEVEVRIGNLLNAEPQENCIFRELLGRDWISPGFGMQVWPQIVSLDETTISDDQSDDLLDVILLQVRQKTAFAILQESPAHRVGELLDALAEEWYRVGPLESTLSRTLILLHGLITLLSQVHSRKRAHGGEPRDYHLSRLQKGHCKTGAAFVEHDKQIFALLLGGAENLMDNSLQNFHFLHCQNVLWQSGTQRMPGTARSVRVLDRSLANVPSRASARVLGPQSSMSSKEIKIGLGLSSRSSSIRRADPTLIGNDGRLKCCNGFCNVEYAQTEDLRRAAQAIWNCLEGKRGQPTVVERTGEEVTAFSLLSRWLGALSNDAYRDVTELVRASDPRLEEGLHAHVMQKKPKLANLLELLASMLGGGALQTSTILHHRAFQGLVLPSNACPQGLDSVPEDRREGIRRDLLQRIRLSQTSEHYYVSGCQVQWNNEKCVKKLIATWLVYTKKGSGWYRSVFTAEPGIVGDLGAVYKCRVERDAGLLNYLDRRFCLLVPNSAGAVMDGKPRSARAASQAVADKTVAMFVNSSLDETGQFQKTANCTREWDPPWNQLGTDKRVVEIPSNLRMGLRLLRPVTQYEELLYPYQWGKYARDRDDCGF